MVFFLSASCELQLLSWGATARLVLAASRCCACLHRLRKVYNLQTKVGSAKGLVWSHVAFVGGVGAAFSAFLTSRNEIAKRYRSHCTKSLESTQTNWWYCDLLEFGRQTSQIICVTFRKNLMLRCVFCPRCQTAVWQKWQKLVLRNIWEGRGVGTWNQASHQT